MHGFHESGRPKIGWAPEFTIPGMHELVRYEFAVSKITFGIFEEIESKTIVAGLVMWTAPGFVDAIKRLRNPDVPYFE